jgi:pimeloyl-ACP methyl ester carboxylesterase
LVVLSVCLLAGWSPVRHTAAHAATSQEVKIKASDGLQIVGTYYPSTLSGKQSPAALLLHQNGGSKEEWEPFIPALLAEGYSVLAVDQRGFGATGGRADWKLAEKDITAMLAWLRNIAAINADEVAIIGASIGSNLSLRACVTDAKCHVVVALSPGLNYFNVTTDTESSSAVKNLAGILPGNGAVRLYKGEEHGVELFANEDLAPMIIQWLKTYNRAK